MKKTRAVRQWLVMSLQKSRKSVATAWARTVQRIRCFIQAPGRTLLAAGKSLYAWLVILLKMPWAALCKFFSFLRKLTLGRIWKYVWCATVAVTIVATAGLFLAVHWPHSQVPDIEPAHPIVFQNQGWGIGRDTPDRQTYYYTPQGTGNVLRNLRYSWLVNLELPWGRDRLADPGHMRAYGFQVDAEPTTMNPDLLPVGFTRHFDPALNEDVLDITCAACHTGSLRVRNPDGSLVSLRIDGGQAMHAFTDASLPHFVPVLIASMTSTYLNPFKFNRFALKVLGEAHFDSGVNALKKEFKITLLALIDLAATEMVHGLNPVDEGYARMDALTRIANTVFGDHITPENYQPGNAPVSYPALWDIWKFDWVQYTGSVAQPMARNMGESLGVGSTFDFFDTYGRPLPSHLQYSTSTLLENLDRIELILQKLRPPVWQEAILGKIDTDKAVKGGIAFIRTCQGCHGPHPAGDKQKAIEAPLKRPDDPHWKMTLLPIEQIGTDPNAAVNFVARKFDLTKTGLKIEKVRELVGAELIEQMDRTLQYEFPGEHEYCSQNPTGETAVNRCLDWQQRTRQLEDGLVIALDAINLAATTNGQALNYVGLIMRNKIYETAGYTAEQIQKMNGFGALDIPQVQRAYKARPLGGVWATAPYFHNGSVRNLYQVLSPQHERDARFFMGQPEFDSLQVGIAAFESTSGGFWLDTNISGNANTGHEFREGYTEWQVGGTPQYGAIGPAYTEEERYQIIEYLKVHLDDPPHSPLYDTTFAGIVQSVAGMLPPADQPEQLPEFWPDGQACNLQEYLGNHATAASLTDSLRSDIQAIETMLEAYFMLPESYQCGGRTRFQRGG